MKDQIQGLVFKKFWQRYGTGIIFALLFLRWPVGQGVKTPLFHGGITSSILVRATWKPTTLLLRNGLVGFLFYQLAAELAIILTNYQDMEFKRWSELNASALKEMRPDFGLRSWHEIAPHEKVTIWQHLEYFFFDGEIVGNYGEPYYRFFGDNHEISTKADSVKFSIYDLNDLYKAKCYAPNYLKEASMNMACQDFYSIFISTDENPFMELLSLYVWNIFQECHIVSAKKQMNQMQNS